MPARKKKKPESDYTEDFAAFWKEYPRRVAKGPALKAYNKARTNGVSHETLIAGVRKFVDYIRAIGTESQFTPHAATWINAERWEDELIIGPARQTANGKTTYGDSIKRAVETVSDYYRDEENLRPERVH